MRWNSNCPELKGLVEVAKLADGTVKLSKVEKFVPVGRALSQ